MRHQWRRSMAGNRKKGPTKHAGKFTIVTGTDVYGELSLKGRKTALTFHHNHDIRLEQIPNACITGVLHDQTKVTLIKCLQDSKRLLQGANGQDGYLAASIFPHFAL